MIFQNELMKSLLTNGCKIAIDNGKQLLTYNSLLQAANKVTRFLLNKGLEKETIVGIQLNDRTDLICTIIGILNARSVFVPLDGSLPRKRLTAITKDLGLEHVIVSKACSEPEAISDNPLQAYFIEDILAEEDNADVIDYPAYEENDSIYIYFTSGSTGTPKGIIGKNCSLLQFVQWEINTFHINEQSRVSQFISPYFDAFLRDVFVPLLAGGTLCIPPAEEDFFTTEKIVPWVDEVKISVIHCVPSLFRLFNSNKLSPHLFENLQYVFLSGEKIIPMELLEWYNVFNERIQLVNLYGPTETTMIKTYFKIKPADARQVRIPVGVPIDGAEVLIANSDLKPCKTFIPGDLYIISKYTTKGYLNLPDLTNEKFIKINAGTANEKILFKTGDKARMLPGNIIDLLGREDRQVKLRGVRIELDEIENVLFQSGLVKNALVINHTDNNKNDVLTAFVIRSESAPAIDLENTLRVHMQEHVPGYMIPSGIVEVKEFPLLPNGKVNYRELLNSLTAGDIVAPVNETEFGLLCIWKEIIGDKPISTEDSFHKVGGNSLAIMNLIGKIQKAYSIKVSLSDLFNNLTIKKQAALIEQARKQDLFLVKPAASKPSYNVSSYQKRVYQQYTTNPTDTSCHHPIVCEVKGNVDYNRIEQALQLLIARHESLRTAFKTENGRLMQVIREHVDFSMEQSQKSGIANFVKPFDPGCAPLLRAGITDNKLIIDIHPIVCDSRSRQQIFTDFIRIYNGEELTPLKLQYKDYAEWEYVFKNTTEYIACREFWLRAFDGDIPKLTWPFKNSDGDVETASNTRITLKINRQTLEPIFNLLEEKAPSAFSTLCSLFFMHLSEATGQTDIVGGIKVPGWIQPELKEVAGGFERILPIRYQVNAGLPFRDFAKNLHQYLNEAIARQLYDVEDIVEELNKNRQHRAGNLFDVLFDFVSYKEQHKPSETDILMLEDKRSTTQVPLYVRVTEEEQFFYFRFESLPGHLTQSSLAVLAGRFKELVDSLCSYQQAEMPTQIENSKSVLAHDSIYI
jgi:amino acid adenylation domain-containing protein